MTATAASAEPPPVRRFGSVRGVVTTAWISAGIVGMLVAPDVGVLGAFILAVVWVAGVIVLGHEYFRSLVGPVLGWEVQRIGRRPKTIWIRMAYAIILSGIFIWLYSAWVVSADRTEPGRVSQRAMARLAETYFTTFMIVQFVLSMVLTPSVVAGSITDEKERRTLEFLLATDLRDREIVFGKLAGRVGSLLLFLSAGVPVLGLLQFFGGIPPEWIISGFIANITAVISLAILAITASVIARRSRDAIALTYLAGVAYVGLSGVAFGFWSNPTMWVTVNILGFDVDFRTWLYPFFAGNPLVMTGLAVSPASRLGLVTMEELLRDFVMFHLIVGILMLAWSGLRMRSIALAQQFGRDKLPWWKARRRSVPESSATDTAVTATSPTQAGTANPSAATASTTPSPPGSAPPRRTPLLFRPIRFVLRALDGKTGPRPDMGDQPILWKETFVDAGLRMGIMAKVITLILICATFVPVFVIFWNIFVDPNVYRYNPGIRGHDFLSRIGSSYRWSQFGEGMNIYARTVGAIVGSVLLLATALRGAGAVLGERDKHTLDVLLTTPLSAQRILLGKWWGCILGLRWGWAWLFSIWALGIMGGGVAPIMIVPLAVLTVIYAAVYAWLGIWCSLTARNSLRASVYSILLAIFFGGGYFLFLVFCCFLPLSFGGGSPGRDVGEVFIDLLSGFAPPVNLAYLPTDSFVHHELRLASRDIPFFVFSFIGAIGWVVLGFVLHQNCVKRFQALANRLPMNARRRYAAAGSLEDGEEPEAGVSVTARKNPFEDDTAVPRSPRRTDSTDPTDPR